MKMRFRWTLSFLHRNNLSGLMGCFVLLLWNLQEPHLPAESVYLAQLMRHSERERRSVSWQRIRLARDGGIIILGRNGADPLNLPPQRRALPGAEADRPAAAARSSCGEWLWFLSAGHEGGRRGGPGGASGVTLDYFINFYSELRRTLLLMRSLVLILILSALLCAWMRISWRLTAEDALKNRNGQLPDV